MNVTTLNEICTVYQPTFTSMECYTAKSSLIFSTTNDVVVKVQIDWQVLSLLLEE